MPQEPHPARSAEGGIARRGAREGSDRLFTPRGEAMHDAAGARVERIAPMDDAPVVPDQHVAGLPGVLVHRTWLCRGAPELVEQLLALLDRQADDIAAAPAPEIKCLAPGNAMGADDRVA